MTNTTCVNSESVCQWDTDPLGLAQLRALAVGWQPAKELGVAFGCVDGGKIEAVDPDSPRKEYRTTCANCHVALCLGITKDGAVGTLLKWVQVTETLCLWW